MDVGGELRLIVAINSNWGTATVEWFSILVIYSFTRVQYLISRTVGYQAAEPNNVTEENCDTFEMFRQCCYFPALQTDIIIVVKNSYNKQLEFVSLSVSDHRSVCLLLSLTITLLLFMSLTIDVGRKSWKAFSVFIFSASNSLTFSITSLAKTWLFAASLKGLHQRFCNLTLITERAFLTKK